jgi:hypothetical protein
MTGAAAIVIYVTHFLDDGSMKAVCSTFSQGLQGQKTRHIEIPERKSRQIGIRLHIDLPWKKAFP